VGRGIAKSASLWPSMGPISLLALLRARRWLFGRRRNFGNFISSLSRCRWRCDNRELASWHSFHSGPTLGAETFCHSAEYPRGFPWLPGSLRRMRGLASTLQFLSSLFFEFSYLNLFAPEAPPNTNVFFSTTRNFHRLPLHRIDTQLMIYDTRPYATPFPDCQSFTTRASDRPCLHQSRCSRFRI